MTLIVSVICSAFVFQVSDRRVTVVYPNGRQKVLEQPLTKAVVFCDRAVFGVTGYAKIEGQRSDLWIANQLKDVRDLGEGFAKIQERLTAVFRQSRYNAPHTITVAGFKLNDDGSSSPYHAMISNQFWDGQWLQMPFPEFRVIIDLVPPDKVGVFAAPGWLAGQRHRQLAADVAGEVSLDAAVGHVVAAIREVAANHEEVGADLLLAVLPKISVGRGEVLFVAGGPPGETPTFYYLSNNSDPVLYGPTFVCGGAIMSDFRAGTLSD